MTKEVQEQEEQDFSGPYRGSYRAEVYAEDPVEEAEATPEDQNDTEQNDEESILVSTEEKQEIKTEEHDYKKRYDDLKKHYDSKLHEWKEEREQLIAQPQQAQEPEYDVDIENFRENYPDVYNVVQAMTAKNNEKELSELREEVSRLSEQEQQLKQKSAYQQLLALHSDFPEIKKSDEFKDWLGKQPPSIAEGITKNSDDVPWASRVLDLYKADIGKTKKVGRPKKKKAAEAAEAVTKTNTVSISTNSDANKKVWTTSEIRKLKPHEFAKLESELDLANAEGRIVNG